MLIPFITFVIIPFGFSIPDTYQKCGETAGTYSHESKIIYLCDGVPGNNEFYKQHEIGHYVWFNLLTDAQRAKYKIEFDKSKVFYREYSKNLEEDFADNYALLQLKERQSYQLQKRINFIKSLIK
jgi:hypothetical protein